MMDSFPNEKSALSAHIQLPKNQSFGQLFTKETQNPMRWSAAGAKSQARAALTAPSRSQGHLGLSRPCAR